MTGRLLKIISNVLFVILGIVLLLAIYSFISINILNNKYVNFFNYTFFEVASDSMAPVITTNDLIIVKLTKEVEVGNNIFFYEVTNGVPSINLGEVTEVVTISDVESTYTINNNHDISSENFIGKTSTATTYRNLGTILNILESRIGFLVLIVLPTLLLFLYEIYRVIIEIKTPIEMEE